MRIPRLGIVIRLANPRNLSSEALYKLGREPVEGFAPSKPRIPSLGSHSTTGSLPSYQTAEAATKIKLRVRAEVEWRKVSSLLFALSRFGVVKKTHADCDREYDSRYDVKSDSVHSYSLEFMATIKTIVNTTPIIMYPIRSWSLAVKSINYFDNFKLNIRKNIVAAVPPTKVARLTAGPVSVAKKNPNTAEAKTIFDKSEKYFESRSVCSLFNRIAHFYSQSVNSVNHMYRQRLPKLP